MLANYPEMFYGKEGKMLNEYEHFVSFDEGNIVDKVRYYLDHEDNRQAIAENGYKKYQECYSSKQFWSKLISLV